MISEEAMIETTNYNHSEKWFSNDNYLEESYLTFPFIYQVQCKAINAKSCYCNREKLGGGLYVFKATNENLVKSILWSELRRPIMEIHGGLHYILKDFRFNFPIIDIRYQLSYFW